MLYTAQYSIQYCYFDTTLYSIVYNTFQLYSALGLRHNLIKISTNIYWGPVSWRRMPCLVETEALFGKTGVLFGKTNILYKISTRFFLFIQIFVWINKTKNRGLTGPKMFYEMDTLILPRKKNIFVETNISMFIWPWQCVFQAIFSRSLTQNCDLLNMWFFYPNFSPKKFLQMPPSE